MRLHENSWSIITAALIRMLVFSANISMAATTNSELPTTQTGYSVSVNVTQTTVESNITINWTAPAGHSASDYIRLAPIDSPDGHSYWTQYLGSAVSGNFNLTIPNMVARYEFRIYRNSDSVRMGKSQSFVANKANFSISVNSQSPVAGGQITTTWESPSDRPPNDRIAITRLVNPANVFTQFTNNVNPKTAILPVPVESAQYEVRYFEGTSSTPSALSQIFTAEASVGSFAGQVKKAGTDDYLIGTSVEVLQNNTVKGSAVTNSNGSYSVPLTIAGTYDLRVTAAGYPTAHRLGQVLSAGNTTVVDFELSDKGSLTGQITKDGSGLNIFGATVQIKQGADVITNGMTNSAGNYAFNQLPAGNYSIEVSATGYAPQSRQNITVSAGEATTQNFSLVQNQAGGSGNLEYVYDAAGRLVATKEQGVIKDIYNYDSTGNLLSISAPQGTVPAILSFSPGSGTAGTQVLIQGVNFTPGQNSISFNGVGTTVISDSTTEILTVVPAGAATGTLSVTTPNGTAVSSSPFVVGVQTGNAPPVVTGFSPFIGHPQDTITISGSNFESEPTDNTVRFGMNGVGVVSSTESNITVRANTSSGKISVTTPSGTGTSTNEFLSIPTSIDLSKVQYLGRTWFGNNKRIEVPSGGKIGVITLEAVAGKRFSVQLFNLLNPALIEVYRPDGRLMSGNTFSHLSLPENWFIDTQTFPLTGTYTVIIYPPSSSPYPSNGYLNPVACNMTIYDVPPDISGEIPLNSFKFIQIAVPGQNGLLTFNATAGQKILMNVKDNTYGGSATITRVVNAGSSPTPVLNYGFSAMVPNFSPDGTTIPVTGTYNLFLNPSGPNVGPMTASVYIVPPDPTYSMNVGESKVFYTTSPGQNAWVEFAGIAGQRISLQVKDVEYYGGFEFSLNKPDGSYLVSPRSVGSGIFIDTMTLPTTGTYKIFMNPPGYEIGHTTIKIFDVPPDIVGSTSINGPAVTVNTAVPGHNPSITFEGIQGEQARVNFTNATVPNGTWVYLKRSNGSIVYGIQINSGTGTISSTVLPVTGTYTVEINPSELNLGGATISVGGDAYTTITPGGSSVTATVSGAGQNAWLSFNGVAGQRVSAKLTNVTVTSGTVSFRKPDGSILGSSIYIGSNNNFLDTVILPVNGVYKVLIDPDYNYTGSADVIIYNVPPDITGTMVIGENPIVKGVSVPGQNILLTFAGNINGRISLEATNVSMTNGIVTIKKPDESSLTSFGYGVNGGGINNVNLPSTGNYQVFINPALDTTGSMSLQLYGTSSSTLESTAALSQSISVKKESVFSGSGEFLTSLSVRKGSSSGSSILSETSSAVSVRFGNSQTQSISSNISVSKGLIINNLLPVSFTKGTSATLTITGSNLTGATAVRFCNSAGTFDTLITVTNVSVNSEGTTLTATIQVSSSAAVGERMVVIMKNSTETSARENTGVNMISIVQ